MLASRATTPHICLRCQRILKKRSSPPLVKIAHRSDEAFSYSKNELKSVWAKVPIKEGPDIETPEKPKLPRGDKHSGPKRIEVVEKIEGKNGKQSKILVLRESLQSTYERTPTHVAQEDAAPIDIMSQLGYECSLADPKEVNKNIDGLRPGEEQLSSWKEFNQLVDELTNGFTVAQLEEYIESSRFQSETQRSQAPVLRKNEDFFSFITPWRPGISKFHKYFDNSSGRGYLLESRTFKQRLAIRIIRDCWNVEILLLTEGVGQFEIQIRSDVLELLLSGKPSHLQNFHDDVLILENEGLEVFRSRNVIRITTTQARKYRIIQEMEKLAGKIEIRKILLGDLMPTSDIKYRTALDLDQWTSKTFDDHTLAELKRTTGITVRREAHGKICLGALVRDSNSGENPVDAARRLLLTARPYRSLDEYSLASADKGLASPIIYCQLEGLNWWGKIRSWFRWVDPIPKETQLSRQVPSSDALSIHYINSKSKIKENELGVKFLPNPVFEDESISTKQWSTKYSTSTYATVGAVIHTHSDSHSSEAPSLDSESKDFISDFSHHVPNITRLLSLTKFEKTRKYDEKIVLRFLPNPFFKLRGKSGKRRSVSAVVMSALPAVEFTCLINREKMAYFVGAEAIVHEKQTDIMLPKEIVDIRFYQRTTSSLLDKKLPAIKKFFGNCNLKLEPGGNIYVPPSIVLPISANLCKGKGLKHFQAFQNTDKQKKEVSDPLNQNIEYLFSGLEIRRRLIFKYEGWRLEYTYIDSGKSGGMRGELSLRPIKNESGVSDQEFISFGLELACRLTSLSTPEMTRFNDITKINSPLVRKYVPVHQSTSDYPRTFLYIPRRIPFEPSPHENTTAENLEDALLPDFEEEVRAFEDEIDESHNEKEVDLLQQLDDSLSAPESESIETEVSFSEGPAKQLLTPSELEKLNKAEKRQNKQDSDG